MTNLNCIYYRTDKCPEEKQPLIICDLCNLYEKKIKCHMCGKVFHFHGDVIHSDCPRCLNPINCVIHAEKKEIDLETD